MTATKKQPIGGLTPAKTGIIAVLAIVLVAVIVMQFGGKSKPGSLAKRRPRKAAEAAATNPADAAPATATVKRKPHKKWDAIPRDEVLQHDPFGIPLPLAGQVVAHTSLQPGAEALNAEHEERERQRQQAIAELMEQRVDMVLMSPSGRVAKIGSLSLRIGDVIHGLRVSEIGPQGVVFVEAEETKSVLNSRRTEN